MLKEYWKKNIVNRGVTPDLEFGIRNKIRIFNSSIFVIGLLYIFYTVVGLLKGDIMAAVLTFLSWAISAFCLYLMSQRKYTVAYHITASLGLVFLFSFSLLYGESTQTHIFFLFVPVASIVLFDNMLICFIYFVLTIIALLTVKIMFALDFTPFYRVQEVNTYLGIINVAVTACLLYLAVRMFKFENLLYSKEIAQQRDLIEEKNKDILSSIHYAQRIQKALLASDTLLQKNLPEHFVMYKPKDIVSGDFYWGEAIGDRFLLCVGDCTGHGVPGAFMSLLGISFINEIVIERKITQPDLIFNHLRVDIIKAMNPEGTLAEGRDGMDAVMCSFDLKNLEMDFSCSNNPMWIVRGKELMQFGADKQPIGMYEGEGKPFTLHNQKLQKGDMVYLFTDGYADQFGGSKGKKFKYKQLQAKLLEVASSPMKDQHEVLDKVIEDWKGGLEQVDDILLIGVRV